MEKWSGKIVVVTGASAGIGAAIAIELARQNLTVVGLARRKEKIEALAVANNLPGKIHAIECDVTEPESIAKAFDQIEKRFGGVDILINNAGTIRNGQLTDLNKPDEDFLLQINTNVTGLILCTRRALNTMKKRDLGYIININSVAGHATPSSAYVQFGVNIYGATKFAVTNLTEVLRLELAGNGNKIKVSVSKNIFAPIIIFSFKISTIYI